MLRHGRDNLSIERDLIKLELEVVRKTASFASAQELHVFKGLCPTVTQRISFVIKLTQRMLKPSGVLQLRRLKASPVLSIFTSNLFYP